MSTLLGLETATDTCSVALMQDERVTVELALHRPRVHAEHLADLVQEALHHGEITADDLTAVAVSMGPGSYTGLRIGVSTAKGLALSAEADLVAVPSLKALAARLASLADPGDWVLPCFPSRRGEVYAAAYHVHENATLSEKRAASALRLEDAVDWLDPPSVRRLWLLGPGSPHLRPALEDAVLPLHALAPESWPPSASSVARLGHERWTAGTTENVVTFEPFYLKDFVAQKKRSPLERLEE